MAYTVAGSQYGPRYAGGAGGMPQRPTMPKFGVGALPENVLQTMGPARAAGVLQPGSAGFNQLNEQVQSIFGRTTDLPIDSPFSDYLISIGYGDANPGAFPERNQRRDLRRQSLQAATDAFGGGGGGGSGSPTMPTLPGGGGGAPGGLPAGGGGGGAPSSVNTNRLANLSIPTIGKLTTPDRIGAQPMSDRIGALNTSKLKAPGSIAFPTGDDPLESIYKKFLSQRVALGG